MIYRSGGGSLTVRSRVAYTMMFLTTSLISIRKTVAFAPIHQRSIVPYGMTRIARASVQNTSGRVLLALTQEDEVFLNHALNHASNGFARTFPNPAVGCVLVRQDTQEVIGSGFHPRAGFPHAEVFALLEAAGHVDSGVDAAKSVVNGEPLDAVLALSQKYSSDGGPSELFGNVFQDTPVTAYVTLEPCCHTGKTPPCASSLVVSKVDRVVVGFRDPNPRVDGGGVKVLEDAGISVDLAEGMSRQACMDMVDAFVKRITPKSYEVDYEWINGAMRRKLRSLAGRLKKEESLTTHHWAGKIEAFDADEVDALEMDAMWMERLDFLLWQKEIVQVRLSKAVKKKKLAKQLGQRIATELGAHVAQTVGHTSLLYRPGDPPMLDIEDLLKEPLDDSKDESDV